MSDLITTKEYTFLLEHIKQEIQGSQHRAHFAVNQELIVLPKRQQKEGEENEQNKRNSLGYWPKTPFRPQS